MAKLPAWAKVSGVEFKDGHLFVHLSMRKWRPAFWSLVAKAVWSVAFHRSGAAQ